MDFFVLVSDRQPQVYRLNIEQSLQDLVEVKFQRQAEELLNDGLVVVPFERENFRPDETEVLEIRPYDLPDLLFQPISNPVGWPVLALDDNVVCRIYCIFGYDSSANRLIFQVVPKTQRLMGSMLGMILSNDTLVRLQAPGIILGSVCHAVYENGALRFRSMWWLKQIIDIGSYYRAATDADLQRLSELDCVTVEDVDSLKATPGQWVRTRVAYILDSEVLHKCPPAELAAKAQEFGVQLDLTEESGVSKILIPGDPRRLRSVLKFLEEEYYAGPITGATYEANSKRRMMGAST